MRRLLLLVGAIAFVDVMFFSALTPLLPHYAHRLDLSKGQAGLLAAMYPIGAGVMGIPSGIAAARAGVKPTLLLALALMAATTVVFGFSDTYWILDSARFVQGSASAFAWTAGFAWLVAAVPPERRGEVIGKAMAAAIGGALFGPVVGAIASWTGTGPAFASIAVLATILGIAAWRTPAFPPGERQPLSALVGAVRDRGMVASFWFVLLPALGFGVIAVLAPLHLSRLGVGTAAIGGIWLVGAGTESILSAFAGRFSDRHGRTLPLRVGLAGATAVTAALAFADARWLIAGLVVLAAMSFGTFWAPALSMLADASEQRGLDYAYGFALVNLAWAPGAAGGSAVGGAIADATTDALPYLTVTLLCAASLALVTLGRGGRATASAGPLALDGESS
jgi:predicted MFS family arabinose efflux permease